jgi:hypothetical protein
MIVFTPAFWLEIQGSAAVIRALAGRTFALHTPRLILATPNDIVSGRMKDNGYQS